MSMRAPPVGPENEPRPLTVLGGAGWTITVSVLSLAALGLTEVARPGAAGDLVNLTACELLAYSLVIFVMLRLYAPQMSVRQVIGLRLVNPLHVALSAIAGAGLYPATARLNAWIESRYPHSEDELAAATKLFDASTPSARWTLVVALVVLMPLAEELFFRGMLFGRLRRVRDAATTVLVTAVFFMAIGAEPRGFPSHLVLGLLLGWLRAQSGSVFSSVAAHASFFVVGIVPMVMHPEADEPEYAWRVVGAALAGGLAAALLGGWMAKRDRWAQEAREGDGG